MLQFISRLLQPFAPEQTERWSQRKWDIWFLRSARLYYLALDPATKRGAFAPFLVEPFSDVDLATQLFREVREYVPSVTDRLASAVAQALSTWSSVDGGPLAEFMLRLLAIIGGDLDSGERLYSLLANVVARLGPPLGERALQQVLQEAVECAVTRLNAQQLRDLGDLIERRAYSWRIPVWRAQFRMLSVLIKTGGLDSLFSDVKAVSPRFPKFVGDPTVKHYAADIFVDGLGLKNVAALIHLNGLTAEQEYIRKFVRFCVFDYRVVRKGSHLVDKLYGDEIDLLPDRRTNIPVPKDEIRQRFRSGSLFESVVIEFPGHG
jgi:hypothetical protein